MADLMQQVKNCELTMRYSQPVKPNFKGSSASEQQHHRSLQALANGLDVPYQTTLRNVQHDGGRAPLLPPRVTQKHPGYIRNESGGVFTS